MNAPYRYPGPKPFTTSQRDVFFGRAEEIKELHGHIKLHDLVVLLGKSGLGKSSLLNAGLLPLVDNAGQLQAISIRFGAYSDESEEQASPLETSLSLTKEEHPLLARLSEGEGDNLWHHLKSRQLEGQSNGFLLVFDQFEELFTYPQAAIDEFTQQLSELLYSDIPESYRAKLESGIAQEANFVSKEELKQLHQQLNIRILCAIRSDRLSLLNQLKQYLPDILENCYELEPLSKQQAEDAILSPAYEKGDFRTPQFDYEDEAVEHLLDFLSEKGRQKIESFQLQILCEHLEKRFIEGKKQRLIYAKDIQDPEAILENYYLEKIGDIKGEDSQLAARKFIEEGLIFEEEERRLSMYEGQLMKNFNIYPELLRQLLDTHLIRSEPSMRGGYTYELSHDTLVVPVLKAKAKRKEAERKEAEAEAKRQKEAELTALRAEAKKERERAEREALVRMEAEVAAIQAKEQQIIAEKAEQEAKEYARLARKRGRWTLAGLMLALGLLVIASYLYVNLKKQEDTLFETVHQLLRLREEAEENAANFRKEVARRYQDEAKIYETAGEYSLALQRLQKALETATPDSLAIKKDIERIKEKQKE
jgi:energy-coupling factor transporter ATP-binding protein EcfA2